MGHETGGRGGQTLAPNLTIRASRLTKGLTGRRATKATTTPSRKAPKREGGGGGRRQTSRRSAILVRPATCRFCRPRRKGHGGGRACIRATATSRGCPNGRRPMRAVPAIAATATAPTAISGGATSRRPFPRRGGPAAATSSRV